MPWHNGILKYDLHRHLGGSISVETVTRLLERSGYELMTEQYVRDVMTYQRGFDDGVDYNFHDFLKRFEILNKIKWTPEAINDSIQDAVAGIVADGIDYCELSASVDKYISPALSRLEAIKLVAGELAEYAEHHNIVIKFILSFKMESVDLEARRQNAAIIDDAEVAGLVDGLDVVGDETQFNCQYFAPIFKDWRKAGKLVLCHAGEVGGHQNVIDAIEAGAHRIRHGIAAAADPYTMDMAKERDICFDMSIFSNLFTGVVRHPGDHPLQTIHEHGCAVTLGTDDPVILNTCLLDEFRAASDHSLLFDDDIVQVKHNAVHYSLDNLLRG